MKDPFKPYRQRFRIWRNNRRLERERRYYQAEFRRLGLVVPSEEMITHRVAARLPGLLAKPKGDLNILAVFHHYNWERDALLPSLEQFGRVRHYDWGEEFDHQQEGWHNGRKQRMNENLVRLARGWGEKERIDVIFTYLSGEIVSPDTVEALAGLGVPIFNLALNDKEAFVGRVRRGLAMGARDICRHFDLCWTSTEDALQKYCVEGGTPLYLPEGANPLVHKPHAVERTIDVSFVGQCYGNRPQVIDRLRQHEIAIEAYGYGWPNGPLSTEEMVKMYSRSRVNLGFGGVDGLTDTFCLKGRDFEIPMSGGLYLTEYNDELVRFFEPGKEIVTYADFDELVAKIRLLLEHPEEAEAIRQRGYRRAMAEHTWEMRFDKIFRLLGVMRAEN